MSQPDILIYLDTEKGVVRVASNPAITLEGMTAATAQMIHTLREKGGKVEDAIKLIENAIQLGETTMPPPVVISGNYG